MRSRINRPSAPGSRYSCECAIGGGDQAPCESDPLRLIAIKQGHACATIHCGGKFPRQVDRIANTSVHPLPPAALCICDASPSRNARPYESDQLHDDGRGR
jgi:hypothetical protein